MRRFFFLLAVFLLSSEVQSCTRQVRSVGRYDNGFEFYLFLHLRGEKYQVKGNVVISTGRFFAMELQDTLLRQRIFILRAEWPKHIVLQNYLTQEIWNFDDEQLFKLLVREWPFWLLDTSATNSIQSPVGEWDAEFSLKVKVMRRFADGKIRRFKLEFGENYLIVDVVRYDLPELFLSEPHFREIKLRRRPSLGYLLEVFHEP